MTDKLFDLFWSTLEGRIANDLTRRKLRYAFRQRLTATLKSLEICDAFFIESKPQTNPLRVLLQCVSKSGLVIIQVDVYSKPKYEEPPIYNHKCELKLVRWAEVVEMIESHEGTDYELRFTQMSMSLRGKRTISLLPSDDLGNSGGVRIVGSEVQVYDDPEEFFAAVCRMTASYY